MDSEHSDRSAARAVVIPKMTVDQAEAALAGGGFGVCSRERLPNDTGVVLRLDDGPVVNVFDNGTVQVQGKRRAEVAAFLEGIEDPGQSRPAPAITNEPGAFAMYKPELEGKHVLVVTPEEIRKIEAQLQVFASLPVTCGVFLADGYMRTMTVEQLCAHENAPRQPIQSITLHTASGDNDPKAEVMITDIGGDNLTVEIYGEPSKVEALRHALEDRFAAMTPSYAWLAKRETAPLALLAIVGALMAMAASAFGLAAFLVVLGVAISRKNRYFPRTAFRIGQGEKRYEFASTMRVVVVLGAGVSFGTSLLLMLLAM